jgi:hypothetical protein
MLPSITKILKGSFLKMATLVAFRNRVEVISDSWAIFLAEGLGRIESIVGDLGHRGMKGNLESDLNSVEGSIIREGSGDGSILG